MPDPITLPNHVGLLIGTDGLHVDYKVYRPMPYRSKLVAILQGPVGSPVLPDG